MLVAVVAAAPAAATPIRPNLKKLLAQPQPKPPAYVPARAGWDGPEMPNEAPANVYTLNYGPSATARAVRSSLVAAAIPDWRVVLGLIAVIFLLRALKRTTRNQAETSHTQPGEEIPRAA